MFRRGTPLGILAGMTQRPSLYGRELSDDQLAQLRAQLESFDDITAIDDDMRRLIVSQWPDLAHKLPPETTT